MTFECSLLPRVIVARSHQGTRQASPVRTAVQHVQTVHGHALRDVVAVEEADKVGVAGVAAAALRTTPRLRVVSYVLASQDPGRTL